MSKDVVLSFARTFLTALGAFFLGKTIFGSSVTADVWQGWLGGGIALASTIWGIADKSATLDAIQSGLRSFVITLGGILIALGKLKADTLIAILGVITPVVAFVYSTLSKVKTSQIATGKIMATSIGKTFKKAAIIIFILSFGFASHAQSLFKPLAKPSQKLSLNSRIANPNIQNSIRPLAGVTASLFSDGTQLAGGIGVGLQHNVFDQLSQTWITQYSVSALVFVDTKASAIGGLVLGVANGLIQIGPGYNFATKQFVILTGFGIKFN